MTLTTGGSERHLWSSLLDELEATRDPRPYGARVVEDFRHLLTSAVRRRVSGAVGTSLSGGIDAAAIASVVDGLGRSDHRSRAPVTRPAACAADLVGALPRHARRRGAPRRRDHRRARRSRARRTGSSRRRRSSSSDLRRVRPDCRRSRWSRRAPTRSSGPTRGHGERLAPHGRCSTVTAATRPSPASARTTSSTCASWPAPAAPGARSAPRPSSADLSTSLARRGGPVVADRVRGRRTCPIRSLLGERVRGGARRRDVCGRTRARSTTGSSTTSCPGRCRRGCATPTRTPDTSALRVRLPFLDRDLVRFVFALPRGRPHPRGVEQAGAARRDEGPDPRVGAPSPRQDRLRRHRRASGSCA